MNILVIGNGFDLAHELPTKYTDFLEWIKAEYALYINLIKQNSDIAVCNINWAIGTYPSKIEVNQLEYKKRQFEVWDCINNNFWVDYFLNNSKYQKENWIDFENEISNVIKSIDADMQENDFDGQIEELSNEYLRKTYLYKGYDALFLDENGKQCGKQNISYKEIRDILHKDLNRLIRALEIYLCEYVEKIDIKVFSPDIKNIAIRINSVKHSVLSIKVISFNYTNTFKKLYDKGRSIEYDFIHGKAYINNIIESNNMVLGIDEYLPDDRKDKDVEFIAFKKFYQRIFKGTGCKYKEWVDEIKKYYAEYQDKLSKSQNGCPKHKLYIFGHSLDQTDGDILRDLILNDNVHTTIFYHNKDAMGQQIANLVKVIGQDELIKRTGGSTKTIEFVQQKPMMPIDNQESN